MNAITVKCPHCTKELEHEGARGDQVLCPHCGENFVVPFQIRVPKPVAPPPPIMFSTLDHLPGYEVTHFHGFVAATVVRGVNLIRDFVANITDAVGGRSGFIEEEIERARAEALGAIQAVARTRSANAVIGVRVDVETAGAQNGMVLVSASGTAVQVEVKLAPPGPI